MAHANRRTKARLLLCIFADAFDGGKCAWAEGGAEQAHSKSKAPAIAVPAAPATPAPTAEPIPVDPLGRTTPYGCVFGFLQAVKSNNLRPRRCIISIQSFRRKKAEELAVQLKAVLDAGLSSSINGLSRDPLGNQKDDLRANRERVGVVETPDGKLASYIS